MTNSKPLCSYSYKNLSLSVWDSKAGCPSLVISRGYKPKSSNAFVNLTLSIYPDNLPVLIALFEAYLKDNSFSEADKARNIIVSKRCF